MPDFDVVAEYVLQRRVALRISADSAHAAEIAVMELISGDGAACVAWLGNARANRAPSQPSLNTVEIVAEGISLSELATASG